MPPLLDPGVAFLRRHLVDRVFVVHLAVPAAPAEADSPADLAAEAGQQGDSVAKDLPCLFVSLDLLEVFAGFLLAEGSEIFFD